ncbi:TIGR01777 family oxidoreductase [Phytoactinopolyspora mesophila]|uniref:TIGR01777 family protein n=1 Tax=Phytoactinopolyspora mesophila TaxID=2650750 RepID=A0A7K3LXG6_9ACTN|nr:TIGR01777 family oxidoreductase [Phytoactinopolyspora mesophila]NDL55724.1 TIGR01777 family protein [Phytoactinopolyspora mesophila]
MTFTYQSEVPASIDEVFAWHERPGAISRLLPPWQPVRVVREAASVRDGVAVIGLPGGLRWRAQHVAAEFDRPHRFVDELVTTRLPIAPPWRHVHEFEDLGEGGTRVVDRVDTRAPRSMLTSMFRYRHDQLAADLKAHQHSRQWAPRPLTFAVTGSSGLVGSALSAFLSTGGHSVVRLVRYRPRNESERHWNPGAPDPAAFAGVDVVIHLAGASIAGRFTEAHKRAIRESRLEPTRLLAEAAARAPHGPGTLITASAVGYYGPDNADTILTESTDSGAGFLAGVVLAWEAATRPAQAAGLRVVNVRTGLVLTPAGGLLRLQRPLFAAGLGGRLGTGEQWMAWIGIDDLVDVYLRASLDETLSGPVNAVAPEPVTNDEYSRTLAHVLGRPAILPVPSLGPRVLLGEHGARELAGASQRAVPARLTAAGHTFRHATVETALRHLLGRAVPA